MGTGALACAAERQLGNIGISQFVRDDTSARVVDPITTMLSFAQPPSRGRLGLRKPVADVLFAFYLR